MEQDFTTSADMILLRADTRGPSESGETQFDRSAVLRSCKFVRSIIEARAKRRKYFAEELFSDPAWDILLELYALKCEDVRISVSKLSVAASVPATTALRWIDKLAAESLVVRTDDPLDARRVWVELSDLGVEAMLDYLRQIDFPQLAS